MPPSPRNGIRVSRGCIPGIRVRSASRRAADSRRRVRPQSVFIHGIHPRYASLSTCMSQASDLNDASISDETAALQYCGSRQRPGREEPGAGDATPAYVEKSAPAFSETARGSLGLHPRECSQTAQAQQPVARGCTPRALLKHVRMQPRKQLDPATQPAPQVRKSPPANWLKSCRNHQATASLPLGGNLQYIQSPLRYPSEPYGRCH